MNTNQNQPDPSGPILAILAAAASVLAILWGAAQLAALTVHHQPLGPVPLNTFFAFIAKLPKHLADPAEAWPPGPWTSNLTGPIPYWTCTLLLLTAALTIVIMIARTFRTKSDVGQDRHARFGAPAWPREATRADLAPLIVKGPTPGRTILGHAQRRLIATEDRASMPTKRLTERTGDRGGVLVVGPARSGKTVIAIGAILEHDWGPVIASSVKTDLLAATIKRRDQLGTIAIFDPLRTTSETLHHGATLVGWSPLHTATTADLAQQVASQLLDAAPIDASVRNNDFWANHAHRLAWVTLYAARLNKATMRDVVLWTSRGYNPKEKGSGTLLIKSILTNGLADPERHADCTLALSIIDGLITVADDTRSGIYASTQTLFLPWEDSRIVANSDLEMTVTLDWLYDDETHTGTGRNTLYVCMPEHPKDAARFAVVFGGLISALTDAAYEKRNRDNKPLPNLLLVLDEAGNTAASWLPQISTTCASVGITLMTFWQSLAQIEHRYHDQAPTLFTNHLTKIFFGGISDGTSGTTASGLTGSHEVQTLSRNIDRTNPNGRNSESLTTTATALVPPEMLRQIIPGDALCIHGTLQPIHLQTRRYWTNRDLRKRADGTIPDPLEVDGTLDGRRTASRLRRFGRR
jgi:type IV secretion system protein VirD4